jgi:dynein heavy chain 2
MGKSLKQHTINPKAMPRTQLLGQIDLDTRQWTDGVLTLSALQVYSEPPGETFFFFVYGLNIANDSYL